MPVTTLAAVRAHKGLIGTELDAAITALIPRVQEAIEVYLSRRLDVQQHVEDYDGHGGVALMLRQAPIVSVQAATVDGQSVPLSDLRTSGNLVLVTGRRWTRGIANIRITYTAGYDTVPPDLELAAIETVLLVLDRRSHIDVTSKALAGETVSYITGQWTPAVRQSLDQHRRVAPC